MCNILYKTFREMQKIFLQVSLVDQRHAFSGEKADN